ncbi:MAG: hypothetical protein HY666_04115 [Chloroflexi bacterium]|nr:hypothetical protein [Chloroflexota bacterium]
MTIGEAFLLAVRWIHSLAAVAWIGGSLFYLVVLRPALGRSNPVSSEMNQRVAREFRGLVDTSIFTLIITGAILAFDRLTVGSIGIAYVATLAAKVILAFWMFYLVWSQRRQVSSPGQSQEAQSPQATPLLSKLARGFSGYNAILILGVLVFLISDLLTLLFEKALVGR